MPVASAGGGERTEGGAAGMGGVGGGGGRWPPVSCLGSWSWSGALLLFLCVFLLSSVIAGRSASAGVGKVELVLANRYLIRQLSLLWWCYTPHIGATMINAQKHQPAIQRLVNEDKITS